MRHAFLLAFVVCLSASSQDLQAAEPHTMWMKYLKGTWTYSYDGLEIAGEVTYRSAADKTALVAKGKEKDDSWVELIGWRESTKTYVFNGYGAKNGNWWISECKDLTRELASGKSRGVLPDGREVSGTIQVKRKSDDEFEVTLSVKSGDEDIHEVGVFKRKKAE